MSIGYPTRPRIPAVRTTSAFEAGAGTTADASSGGFIPKVVDQVGLTPEEKPAAITRVRWLERDILDVGRVCPQLSRHGRRSGDR